MSSNLKVNSLVPATGTEIGIGTTGGSIDFRCPATFGGNVTIGGTLTYDEVINIDSIGVITARSNIDCNGSLDVDGHTDLDNVSIAGVTTFSVSPVVPNGGYYKGIINSGSQQKIVGGYISGTDTLRLGESMYLTSTGLGIGENSPEEELHITAATPVIRLEDSDTSRQSQIVGIDGNLRFDADNGNAQADTNISFRTDGTERLRIDSSGRIIQNYAALPSVSSNLPYAYFAPTKQSYGGVDLTMNLHDDASNALGNGGGIGFSANSSTGAPIVRGAIRGNTEATNSNAGYLTLHTRGASGDTTEKLRITSGGQVRIGNENNLALWGQNNRLQVAGTDWNTSGITIACMSNSGSANLILGNSKASTPGGSGGALTQDNRLGYISFVGDDGTDMNTVGAAIVAELDSNASSNSMPGRLRFYTGGNSQERLRIDSNGNVTKPTNFHLVVDRSSDQTGYNACNMSDVIEWNRVQTGQSSSGAASHFDTSTGLFTAPVTGLYLFHVAVNCSYAVQGAWLNINGSRPNFANFYPNGAQSADAMITYKVTAGHTVGVKWYYNCITNGTINSNALHTWWRIVLLG